MSAISNIAEPPQRHRFQFSLRALFIFMTICALPLGWIGIKVRDVRRQKAAVEAIEELGGKVWFDYQFHVQGDVDVGAEIPGPEWLRTRIGNDFFRTATFVDFENAASAPLEYLEDFPKLEELHVNDTHLTNSDLEHLRGLSRLTVLDLSGTPTTDVGLEHLKGLTNLKDLWLKDTSVTDAGVEALRGALPECSIVR